MFNKFIAQPKKILSTPESKMVVAQLRKINEHIRKARAVMLQEWVNGILRCDPDNLTNIYSHIHMILLAFIKKRLHVDSEEFFFLMKCGNAILNTGYVTDPNKSQYGQYKYTVCTGTDSSAPNVNSTGVTPPISVRYMVALYFLNYIKKLTTYDFRNKYVCNLNEYIRTCYNNILVDTRQQTDSHIEMRHIYTNLKKIVYVKQYPYSIDSKIFSIMLEYWQHIDYNINEIPASYITKDRILSYDELSKLEVSQYEMDLLFGAYASNTKDISIELNDEPDITELPNVEEAESGDPVTNIIQNGEDEVQDENEEYVYPDDYD